MLNCTYQPLAISMGINASFLAFYTGYSKATKSYTPSSIITVLTFKKGLDHSLVELNKSVSLSGLCTLAAAFLPAFSSQKETLIKHAMGMLTVHTAYSIYKYYGSKNIPKLSEWWPFSASFLTDLRNKDTRPKGVKKLSLFFGVASQALLWSNALDLPTSFGKNTMMGAAIIYGTAHFYLMEIDYKWVLQVRPFAFLPFPLALFAAWRALK